MGLWAVCCGPVRLCAKGPWGCDLWASGAMVYKAVGLWAVDCGPVGLWGCGHKARGAVCYRLWACTPVAIDAANEANSGTKVSFWHKMLYLPSVS